MASPDRHLLILDDDERISTFLRTVAAGRGWNVQVSANAAAFQASYRGHVPDAIMLDLQLGPSDGVEQLHFLREQNFPGHVVLMSGFDTRVLASAQQVGAALGLAIHTVIEKPARAVRVRAVLAELENAAGAAPALRHRAIDGDVQAVRKEVMLTPGIVAAAIAAGEMELFLQPIVSAADNTVTRAEGLIRWRHPLAGLIAPDDFVPLAEQDQSVIDQLTRWVIAAGVEQHRKLAELGFAVQVCVNVSGRNLRSLDFPDQVAALLETASAPPHAIALEVTESAATSDLRATADVLTRLRLKGLPLAIDDFGTGHSSLAALRDMPFSTVKIDKSFVRDLRQSRDSLIIVQSIIDLARNLRLACVAEGVEEAEIARQLVANGIGALQGFYYSPPLPFDAFVSWLRAWSGNAFKPQQMVEVSTL